MRKGRSQTTSIRAEAVYAGQTLAWELYKRTTGGAKLYASKYKEAFSQFMSAYQDGADLPLLAYYSDSFPHRNTKETKFALDTIKLDRIPRNFGYYQWDMEVAQRYGKCEYQPTESIYDARIKNSCRTARAEESAISRTAGRRCSI